MMDLHNETVEHDRAEHAGEMHIVRPPVYLGIFFALLVLTALTTGMSYVDLGVFNAVIALAIACFKASLVVLFFMHVHYSSRLLKMTVGAGLFTFMLLISLTMTDYISRAWGRF
jgi:cytochrome c oxidase subunit 4